MAQQLLSFDNDDMYLAPAESFEEGVARLQEEDTLRRMNSLQRGFLIHSYLYYKLDESLISDQQFDTRTRELLKLIQDHPQLALRSTYWEICKDHVNADISGYGIVSYPPKIISIAFHILYGDKSMREHFTPDSLSFADFVKRYGMRAYTPEEADNGY